MIKCPGDGLQDPPGLANHFSLFAEALQFRDFVVYGWDPFTLQVPETLFDRDGPFEHERMTRQFGM